MRSIRVAFDDKAGTVLELFDSLSSGPVVHAERCSTVRFWAARCRKCLSLCPARAIHLTPRSLKVNDACLGCGFCVASCPTGVFTFAENIPGFMENEEQPGTIYCLGFLDRSNIPAKTLPPFVVPCLGSIAPSFVLRRFLQQGNTLQIVTGTCRGCPMSEGAHAYRKREKDIRSLLDYLGAGPLPVKISTGCDDEREAVIQRCEAFEARTEETRVLSRRDFFKGLRDHAAKSLQKPAAEAATGDEAGSDPRGPTEGTRLLVEIVKRYAGGAFPEGGAIPGFREIRVDENCTGCGACAGLCPTGALTADETPESFRLWWRPSHCSRCDLCIDVCGRKALHVMPCRHPGRIAGERRFAVKEFDRRVCQECGSRFLSSRSELSCPACLKAGGFMEELSMMIDDEERRAGP